MNNQKAKTDAYENLVEKLTQEVIKRMSPESSTSGQNAASMQASGAQKTSGSLAESFQDRDLAKFIDHTLLKPEATAEQVRELCDEAKAHHFATVCVNSSKVRLAAELVKGSGVKAIAVVGFPLGAAAARAKAFETLEAVRNGAQEIDTVINIGALKSKDYKTVHEDIAGVVAAASPLPVKVILETSHLNEEEKIIACAISVAAGAAFVKTSTGFSGGGATEEDIRLMRRVVGPDLGVKASGGVRDAATARKMLAAGATRLGTSSSVAIVTGQTSTKSY